MAIYRPLRQRRYDNYITHHFRPFEARELSGIRYSEAPYLRRMIRERDQMWKSFSKWIDTKQLTKRDADAEWVKVIKNNYENHDWLTVKDIFAFGKPAFKANPFKMLKYYRQQSIDMGEYHPPKKKHSKNYKLGYLSIKKEDVENQRRYKGDVAGQKARERERIKNLTGTDLERYRKQRAAQKERARERRRSSGRPNR